MDGIPTLDITAKDGKRLKTVQSARVVPVHDELIRLGFLKFVHGRPLGAGIGSLFAIPAPLNGNWGQKAGNWFREKLLPTVFGKDKRVGLGFHSFRHKAETDMRSAGVREDISNRLLGHKAATVAAGYGRYDAGPTKQALHEINVPTALVHIPPRG